MIDNKKRRNDLKKKKSWFKKIRKKTEDEPVVDNEFLIMLKNANNNENLSPTRSMPREIRCDSSPTNESLISVMSGTTELDPRPPSSLRSVVPLITSESSPSLPVHNKRNFLEIDSPVRKRVSMLLPNVSDSEEESLFLHSTQSSSKREFSHLPMNSASRKMTKRKHSQWPTAKLLEKLANDAFHEVDSEDLGRIDKTEFFYALMLVHLNLSTYFGPVAYRSHQKERTESVFLKRQGPMAGFIGKDKFIDAVIFLCSDVIFDSIKRLTIVLLAVSICTPLFSRVLSFFLQIFIVLLECIIPFLPIPTILNVLSYIIPQSIYETALSSSVSCLLGFILVPSALFMQQEYDIPLRTIKRNMSKRFLIASKNFFKKKEN